MAPKQYNYVEEVLDNTTATFGFYNESLATTEAGDIFDDAIVEIYLQNATPQEAFQELQDYYEKIRWTEEKQMHRQKKLSKNDN